MKDVKRSGEMHKDEARGRNYSVWGFVFLYLVAP